MVSASISFNPRYEIEYMQSPGANYPLCPLSLTPPAFSTLNTQLSHPLGWTAFCATRFPSYPSAPVRSFSLFLQLSPRKRPELQHLSSFETDKRLYVGLHIARLISSLRLQRQWQCSTWHIPRVRALAPSYCRLRPPVDSRQAEWNRSCAPCVR
jgi:hypothetical protein